MGQGKDAKRVWFITGCSTGLGRALAERVLKSGDSCVATARNKAQIDPIVTTYPDTGIAVALDVTDASQAETAVRQAERTFGRIDILVNNAGRGYNSGVEEGEDEVIRKMFDANFFAAAGLMRRVLPGMRARGKGHVINISSIGGLIGNPGTGYYCATKFALEGLSQSLAAEARALGIRVTLVEPGPFRTDFQGRSMTIPKQSIDAYAATAGARRTQLRERLGKEPGDPQRAADAIMNIAGSDDPPLHLALGRMAVDRARDTLRAHLQSIDNWEALSLSADYPQ